MSISRAFTWLAEQDPDRPAVITDDVVLTRGELDAATNRVARALIDRGVRSDDLVTLSLPNGAALVLATIAVWKAGATPQPVSPSLPDTVRRALLDAARPALVLGTNEDDALPSGWVTSQAASEWDAGRLPDLAASSWKAPTSSGSTGIPKIVRATAPSMVDPTHAVTTFLPTEQVQLVSGPLWHSAVFTYAFRGLMTGHTVVVHPRFDARRVLAAVAEHRVTWLMLTPTAMHRLIRLPEVERAGADLRSVSTMIHIGAPCAPWLKRAWIDWLGPESVVEVYAGTESPGLTVIDGVEWLAHPGSVGRPAPGSQVTVLDHHDVPCAPGVVGEVFLSREGPVPYTYLGGAHARRRGNRTSLGDLGYLDTDGYLYLVDRVDDAILTGTVTVHPPIVEAVLESRSDVRSAVVVGVADDDLGERVVAVVDLGDSGPGGPRPATAEEAASLRRWAADRLDPDARPREYWVASELLRDDAGKVNRRQMRRLVQGAASAPSERV